MRGNKETRRKKRRKIRQRSRLDCVCQVAAGPGDRIVRYQQVLAMGIQSKIFFLRSRSSELRTWKDFISLSRTSQNIFSSSGHLFLLSFSRKPFIPSTKIFLLFHLPVFVRLRRCWCCSMKNHHEISNYQSFLSSSLDLPKNRGEDFVRLFILRFVSS